MLRHCHFSLCMGDTFPGSDGVIGRDTGVKWGTLGGYLIIYTPQMGRDSDEEDTDGHVLCNNITSIMVMSVINRWNITK